jgi:hypothetical protein
MAARPRRAPVADISHWGAPTGGLNSVDNVAAMAPTDAVRLDNVVCETTYLRLRRGSTLYANISRPGPVRSLMVWGGPTTQKLLAASGGTVADISIPATPVSLGDAFTSDIWQSTNFATPGGQFLVAVNGTAQQWTYDGTTFAAAANTFGPGAPTSSKFACVAAYQQRLYFAASDSLWLYYLPVNVLQGALHAIDLGSFLAFGGAIADIGTWTRDNAYGGSDDLLVIVTTHGEALVYQGIDPDTAGGFVLAGRFVIGEPVGGHRALCRLGPDMMLICQDGFQAMANYLALGESKALTSALSRKIGNAVSQAVKANKPGFGWEAILHSANNIMIVNIPQAGGGFYQYVVNTITGAWSRFVGLNAQCWAIFAGKLFFGDLAGDVVQADFGNDDQGVPIAYDIVTSFQVLGQNAHQKRATMCRPYLIATGSPNPTMDVNVDFNISPVTSAVTTTSSGALWNQAKWNEANWSSEPAPQSQWFSVDGIGTTFAIRMSGVAQSATLQILAWDLAFETGVGFV